MNKKMFFLVMSLLFILYGCGVPKSDYEKLNELYQLEKKKSYETKLKLESEIEALKQINNQLNIDYTNKYESLKRTFSEVSTAMVETLNKYKDIINLQKDFIKKYDESYSNLLNELERKKIEINKLKLDYLNIKTQFVEKSDYIKSLSEKIYNLENRLSEYKSTITNLNNELIKKENNISRLSEEINNLEIQKKKLNDDLNQKDLNIKSLSEKIYNLENRLSEYKSTITNLNSELIKKENNISRLSEEINNLEIQKKKLIDDLNQKDLIIKNINTTFSSINNDYLKKIKKYNEDLIFFQEVNRTLKSKYNDLENQYKKLNNMYDNIKNDFENIKSDYENLLKKYNNTYDALNEVAFMEEKINNLLKKEKNNLIKIEELKKENEELKKELISGYINNITISATDDSYIIGLYENYRKFIEKNSGKIILLNYSNNSFMESFYFSEYKNAKKHLNYEKAFELALNYIQSKKSEIDIEKSLFIFNEIVEEIINSYYVDFSIPRTKLLNNALDQLFPYFVSFDSVKKYYDDYIFSYLVVLANSKLYNEKINESNYKTVLSYMKLCHLIKGSFESDLNFDMDILSKKFFGLILINNTDYMIYNIGKLTKIIDNNNSNYKVYYNLVLNSTKDSFLKDLIYKDF
ncbi:hypothetical protein XO12_02305 [Marinitoga sp. 1154]|uniref:hypothetical protein n=1 Tax=Marinitoga sp. 1154 TaxID=1643335 RepID=UPI001586C748|nr:hypothetical protein [Marinitoga sp. 1154]NUU98991.1 hypothetical protein [Marinitoga sp. 1154]